MKRLLTRRAAAVVLLIAGLVLVAELSWQVNNSSSHLPSQADEDEFAAEYEREHESEAAEAAFSPDEAAEEVKEKKERYEYFQRLARDPATGRIPPNIRTRALAYARTLPTVEEVRSGDAPADGPRFDWFEAGPNDVGGRTRALALDVDDPQTLLAGGVSGGMWKSTDGGATWSLTNTPAQRLSVTSVAQDPRPGHTDTWYYAAGEYRGNSAGAPGAAFRGGGVYKSTDNGDSWTKIIDANGPTSFDSPFDYVHRIVVNPATGSVFAAGNAYGLFRSTDGGASFNRVLGRLNDHRWVEVTAGADGTLLAVLSSTGFTTSPANAPGVYRSTDDGQTWANITPPTFPNIHDRSVAAFAPSNPDVAYVFTTTLQGRTVGGGTYEDLRLHRFDLSTDPVTSSDRSDGLYSSTQGFLRTQGSYDMSIGVKPDDPSFVVLGGTSLFRSDDGFSSDIQRCYDHIGGYSSGCPGGNYRATHHPDQQIVVFDPTDPDRMWSGSDGGVYLTNDVDVSGAAVSWIDKNNGYNVTQLYTVDIPDDDGDDRVGGGAQDNGTPYLGHVADGAGGTSNSQDISGADGAYLYFGEQNSYVSTQGGRVLRLNSNLGYERRVDPSQADNQFFIHPFAVDPIDEDVMYYPGGNKLYRTNRLSTAGRSSIFWNELTGLTLSPNCDISALAVSHQQPAHRLYFGASCFGPPKLFRLDDADAGDGSAVQDISISGLPNGTYVHRIAVNPNDADELLVAHSNYNVTGLYYSDDGGQTFTAVEGNLTGDAGHPGPSLRSVSILPTPAGTGYLVGTSTGVYSTTELDGGNTTWALEAAGLLGNAIVEAIDSRTSDDRVALGTHGRGIFLSTSHDPLPVELTSFDAQATGAAAVRLTWATAGETGNSGFAVQMQSGAPGDDRDEWTKAGFVHGAGTTTEAQQYDYRVRHLQPGAYRFRLKQIDTGGEATFSAVESAALSTRGTHQLTAAYPNPFHERAQFSLSVAEAQNVSVDLYDARGRKVRSLFDGSLPADQSRTFRLDAEDLASGVYFYRATGRDFSDSGRLVLVR